MNKLLKVCFVCFDDIQSICRICHVHTLYVPEENRKKKFHDIGIRTVYLMHTARLFRPLCYERNHLNMLDLFNGITILKS
jgi:hypothetical protein